LNPLTTELRTHADGHELLCQLCHYAIAALSLTVPVLSTLDDYPDVYHLAAAAIDFIQIDTTHGNTHKSSRLQSKLSSLAVNVNLMRCDLDHDLLLSSLPVTLRKWKRHGPRDPDSITTVDGRIRFSEDISLNSATDSCCEHSLAVLIPKANTADGRIRQPIPAHPLPMPAVNSWSYPSRRSNADNPSRRSNADNPSRPDLSRCWL
jgi:hypothetical protein